MSLIIPMADLFFPRRDIDLLRDVNMDDYGKIIERKSMNDDLWKCSHCYHLLDIEEIENRLIEDAERLVAGFLSQDFRCPKTHQVSIRQCASHSDLAIPFQMDMPVEEITKQMKVMHLVASSNGFDWLRYTIETTCVGTDFSSK